ncbi:hypothetical protein LSH36_701g02040 [Paralvinella palmiformis]|uniref:Uncharacterized protein n=1 Tax=Paralvinella palmiformis TaxID=53620 RepID=A0AAD9J226_9ANNE|nr:hypothetical protein LSH36_701g02040 [Paralvinella palmiformis]
MKIPDADGLSIPVAHRIGPKSNKIRPLLVTLPVSDQFAMIMCHTKYLAGNGTGETLHMFQHEKSPLWIRSPEENPEFEFMVRDSLPVPCYTQLKEHAQTRWR